MKIKRYSSLIFFLIGFVIVLTWFCLDIKESQDLVSKFAKEYPIIRIDEQIYGRITEIYRHDPKRFRIMSFSHDITINDTLKRGLVVDNEVYSDRSLHDILAIGDVVQKQRDSTTITIYRIQGTDTIEFRFPLLNEKLHPLKK